MSQCKGWLILYFYVLSFNVTIFGLLNFVESVLNFVFGWAPFLNNNLGYIYDMSNIFWSSSTLLKILPSIWIFECIVSPSTFFPLQYFYASGKEKLYKSYKFMKSSRICMFLLKLFQKFIYIWMLNRSFIKLLHAWGFFLLEKHKVLGGQCVARE